MSSSAFAWLGKRGVYRVLMVLVGALLLLPFLGVPIARPVFFGLSGALVLLGLFRKELSRTVILSLLLFYPQTISNGTSVFTFTILLLIAAAMSVVLWIREGHPIGISRHGLWWTAAILVLLVVVTIISRTSFHDSATVFRTIAIWAVLAFAFVNSNYGKTVELRTAFIDLSWLGAAVGVIVIVQVVLQHWPFLDANAFSTNYTAAIFHGRPGGTLGHPIFMSISACVGAFIAGTVRGRWWIVALSLNTAAAVLSQSRSAWLVLVFGIVLVCTTFLSRRISKWALYSTIGAIGAIAIGVLIVLATSRPLQSFLDSTAFLRRLNIFHDASGDYRTSRIHTVWDIVTADPLSLFLGHGVGASSAFLNGVGLQDSQPNSFDMSYLSIWMDVGVFVVALIFIPILWVLFSSKGPARYVALTFLVACIFVTAINWIAILALPVIALAARMSEKPLKPDKRFEASVDALAGSGGTTIPSAPSPSAGAAAQ